MPRRTEDARQRPQVLRTALGGLLAGSLLEALLRPGPPGLQALDLEFLATLAGNLVPGLVLAALLARRHRRPRAAAFTLGLALGGGALLGGLLGDALGLGRMATLLATALLVLAAWRRPLPAPPGPLLLAVDGLGGVAVLLLLLGAGAADPVAAGLEPRALPPAAAGTVPGGPNVLLVSIDSLRADDAFRPEVPTPTLDGLRRKGRWSPAARTPAPAAVPAHFAMLTGRSPAEPACRDARGRFVLATGVPALAELLRAAGWRTVAVLWNSLPGDEAGLARGFELYHNPARRGPRLVAAETLAQGTWLAVLLPRPEARKLLLWLAGRRIRGLGGDPRRLLLGHAPARTGARLARAYLERLEAGARPWFLFLHFPDLHQPYLPPPETRGLRTAGAPLPPPYTDLAPDTPGLSERIQKDLRRGVPGAPAAAEHLHRVYQEELAFVDRQLGEVLAAVAASRRPTVVLVTSDHGEQFGEHGRMGHGNSLSETLLRVPLFLAGPGIEPGRLAGMPVLEDVAPTLLRRCGLRPPTGMAGHDLLAPPPGPRSWLAASDEALACYRGPVKLLCRAQGLGRPEPELTPLALFHLARDPAEEEDLLAAAPALAAALLELARELIRPPAEGVRPGGGGDPGHGGGG